MRADDLAKRSGEIPGRRISPALLAAENYPDPIEHLNR
jgi:hypothetical protein